MRGFGFLPIVSYVLVYSFCCHQHMQVSIAFSFNHPSNQQKQQKVDAQHFQGQQQQQQTSPPRQQQQPHSSMDSFNNNNPSNNSNRRKVLQGTASIFGGLLTGSVISSNINGINAWGADEIFKKNPLLNPILEQIRIWEQAEADNIKYGGELERGDAGNKGQVDAYPKLLVPILRIAYDIERIQSLVGSTVKPTNSKTTTTKTTTIEQYEIAYEILKDTTKYNKIAFKKIQLKLEK